jgi:hypothetical protein
MLQVPSVAVSMAVDAYVRSCRAERAALKARSELHTSLSRLSGDEVDIYVSLTEGYQDYIEETFSRFG